MLTNRQLLHEQFRLGEHLHDICKAIETMRAIELDVRQRLAAVEAEWNRRCEQKAEPIAKHDDAKIVITDIDGETA